MKILDKDEIFNEFSHITNISKNKTSEFEIFAKWRNFVKKHTYFRILFSHSRYKGVYGKSIFLLMLYGLTKSTVSKLKPSRQW
jgi:hypothetical protein